MDDYRAELDAIEQQIQDLQRRRRYYQLLGPFIRRDKVRLRPGFEGADVIALNSWFEVDLVRLGVKKVVVVHGGKRVVVDILSVTAAPLTEKAARPRSPDLVS